jgi:hypothetical protein
MSGWRKLLHHGGHDDCIEAGSSCFISVKAAFEDNPISYMVTSSLPIEERKDFHDDDLQRVSDEINKLLNDVRKKRADKRLSIMRVPNGLFLQWMPENCPTPDDGVEKKEYLEDSDYDHLRLK